jgi:hypothetical protein
VAWRYHTSFEALQHSVYISLEDLVIFCHILLYQLDKADNQNFFAENSTAKVHFCENCDFSE